VLRPVGIRNSECGPDWKVEDPHDRGRQNQGLQESQGDVKRLSKHVVQLWDATVELDERLEREYESVLKRRDTGGWTRRRLFAMASDPPAIPPASQTSADAPRTTISPAASHKNPKTLRMAPVCVKFMRDILRPQSRDQTATGWQAGRRRDVLVHEADRVRIDRLPSFAPLPCYHIW
jgi:hypothetical protein